MHKRLAFIDTLRGVAVLCVLFQHALEQIILTGQTGDYQGMLHGLIGYYFNFGRFGVVLFFFVSGFVVPYSFPNSPAPIRDFAISRFFRLYPSYWLAIILALLILPITEARDFPTWQILVNLTMFQNLVGVPNMAVAHWTLAIELIFYIGCIFLFATGLLQRSTTVFLIVIAVCLVGIVLPALVPNRVVWRLLEVVINVVAMLIGKIIRDTVMGGKLRWWHVAACLGLYSAFAITIFFRLYGGVYQGNFFYSYSIAFSYIAAGFVFLIFACFGDRLSWRSLAFVGTISYSVYLMQVYVLSVTLHLFGAGNNLLQWLLFMVGVLVATILISWVSFTVVEKPAIAFGRRFRSQGAPAAAAVPLPGRSVA